MGLSQVTIEMIAAAIANARGNRRGVPSITNVLDILPPKLKEEVIDDAKAVMKLIEKSNGWVKVTDRMPPVGSRLLVVHNVWLSNVDESLVVEMMVLRPEGDWMDEEGERYVYECVTHWQPIPLLPK